MKKEHKSSANKAQQNTDIKYYKTFKNYKVCQLKTHWFNNFCFDYIKYEIILFSCGAFKGV